MSYVLIVLWVVLAGRDISEQVAPVDDLFEAATMEGCGTTGVGDGGNELGMGKVRDRVEAEIKHGPTIASTTAATFLIAAGVSNWGGYALAAALAVLHYENTAEVTKAHQMLQTAEIEAAAVAALNTCGVMCGITQQSGTVDGLALSKHAEIIKAISDAADVAFMMKV